MKLGIIINTKDPESAWNALHLGNAAFDAGHEFKVILIESGVEIEKSRMGNLM